MKILLFLLVSVFSMSTEDENVPILNGEWVGTLTQDKGGFREKYEFKITLKQEGRKVSGISTVKVDNLHATMQLTGEWTKDGQLVFSELQKKDQLRGMHMDWCFKHVILDHKKSVRGYRLIGEWSGYSEYGACVPGKIFLRRPFTQA
ncbi:MAG: hypothetical protein AAFO07_22035 [Bacteroidota bacterium]